MPIRSRPAARANPPNARAAAIPTARSTHPPIAPVPGLARRRTFRGARSKEMIKSPRLVDASFQWCSV